MEFIVIKVWHHLISQRLLKVLINSSISIASVSCFCVLALILNLGCLHFSDKSISGVISFNFQFNTQPICHLYTSLLQSILLSANFQVIWLRFELDMWFVWFLFSSCYLFANSFFNICIHGDSCGSMCICW